jgi:hypothetical protein
MAARSDVQNNVLRAPLSLRPLSAVAANWEGEFARTPGVGERSLGFDLLETPYIVASLSRALKRAEQKRAS